jgi:hypothetical protein
MLVSIVDDRSEIQLAVTLRRAGYACALESDIWLLEGCDGVSRHVIGFHVEDLDDFIEAFREALPWVPMAMGTMRLNVDRTTGGARLAVLVERKTAEVRQSLLS